MADGTNCPLTAVHRRVEDAAVNIRRLEDAYFRPDDFRRELNAVIQSLRNITWILQSNKHQIPEFDTWYKPWQDAMVANPILRWAHLARNRVVKQGDLETYSRARVAVVTSYIAPKTVEFEVAPWSTAEDIAFAVEERLDIDPLLRKIGVVQVERRWVDSELPEYELLDAMHYDLECMSLLLEAAHERVSANGSTVRAEFSECRPRTQEGRTARLRLADMTFAHVESIPQKLSLERASEAFKRYCGDTPSERNLANETRASSLRSSAEYFFGMARAVIERDGYHGTFAILIGDSGVTLIKIDVRDKAEKFLMWRHVAEQVRERGASTIMVVGEMWQAVGPSDDSFIDVQDLPNKSECLALQAVSRDGEFIEHYASIERSEDGAIRLGETQSFEGDPDLPGFLTPIFEVWKQMADE